MELRGWGWGWPGTVAPENSKVARVARAERQGGEGCPVLGGDFKDSGVHWGEVGSGCQGLE